MTRFFRNNGGFLHFAVIVFFLAVCNVVAQPPEDDGEEFDDFNFDDIPVEDAELDYIGFGGGYLGSVSLVNYDELNAVSNGFGIGNDEFKGPMLLSGGGGFIGGIVVPNTRLGIYSVGGSKEATTNLEGGEYRRTMRFSTGYVAAQLEYAIFLPGSGLMLFPGVMVGRSSSDIELNQTRISGLSFNNAFSPPGFGSSGGDSLVSYAHITRNSLHLQPTATVDWAINSFLMIRGGVGYAFNFGGTWTDPSGTEISDVPEITADGLNIHFGLFIGLFQK